MIEHPRQRVLRIRSSGFLHSGNPGYGALVLTVAPMLADEGRSGVEVEDEWLAVPAVLDHWEVVARRNEPRDRRDARHASDLTKISECTDVHRPHLA